MKAMRFHYSFQKIVDLKSSEKTQAEWYLSDAVNRLRDEEQSLQTLHQEQEHLHTDVLRASEQSTTASELMLYQSYINHLNHRIVNKLNDIQQAKVQVEDSQQRLTAKMKEEKVWLKARERSLQQFNQEVNRIEQNQLDEMATNRHRHSS